MALLAPSEALAKLQEHQSSKTQLSIIKISEPIASSADAANPNQSPSKRTSDASTDALENPTPASLEADLVHYRELFSKLRFSYLEQVTKEKFLRAIVGDPPLVVGHNENVELEAQLVQVKSELRARKEEVRILTEEMEAMGRDLAKRYEKVQLQISQLSTLPDSISNLESTISALRALAQSSEPNGHGNGSQALPLPATLSLISEREAELANLDRQIASLKTTLPRKTREAEGLERELAGLERKKGEVVAQAKEAQRKKQEGESDGLEDVGRWYRSAERGLKGLVGNEG